MVFWHDPKVGGCLGKPLSFALPWLDNIARGHGYLCRVHAWQGPNAALDIYRIFRHTSLLLATLHMPIYKVCCSLPPSAAREWATSTCLELTYTRSWMLKQMLTC